MPEFRCPEDDGYCTYPDFALVALNGHLSVLRAEAVEQLFPELPIYDIARLDLEGLGYGEVIDAVLLSLLSHRSPIGGDEMGVAAGARSLVERVEARLVTSDGVIASCSCEHVWVVPAESR